MKLNPIPHRLYRPKINRKAESPARWSRFKAGSGIAARSVVDAANAVTLFAAGSHPQETTRLPKGEVRSLRVEGALVLCSTTFICAVFASAMVIAKMPLGAIIPMLALMAAFWLLIDRSLLAAFNMTDGEKLAVLHKTPGYYPVSPKRGKIMVVGRVLFSVIAMSLVTIMARTVIFGDDIDQHLAIQHRKANAKVQAQSEGLVDRQIGDAQTAFNKAMQERNEVRGLVSRADQPVDTGSIDAEIAAERKAILDTKQRYSRLVADFYEAKRAADAERAGVQAEEGDSGVKGEGSRYAYHQSRMNAVRSQVGILREAAQRSAQRLRELEGQKTGTAANQRVQSDQDRTALNPRLTEAEAKMARLAKQRADIVASRGALVRKLTEANPAFVPMSNGLIARVQALDAVQRGSFSAMLLSLAMTAMFSFLELAVLLLRIINGTPHIVGAEKLNLNRKAVEEILDPGKHARRRARHRPANDLWASFNDNSDDRGEKDAA